MKAAIARALPSRRPLSTKVRELRRTLRRPQA